MLRNSEVSIISEKLKAGMSDIMLKPKITVIVPVYNNELYLKQCVDSLISQTLKEIEILLIDDGSKDKSGVLCDQYAKLDSRIRVIHKKNEGLGLTRNRGMQEAKGEYFAFLDSDDYVAPDMYEKLWNQATKYNAEACMCGIARVFGEREISYDLKLEKEFFCKSEIQDDIVYRMIGSAPEDINESTIGYSMCTGIYKIDVVRRHNMRFYSEREYKVEDVLFKIEYYSYINGFTYIKDSCYKYRCNENSLTRKYRPDVLEATIKCYCKEFEILDYFGYEKGRLYATRMLLADVRNAMRMIMKQDGLWKSVKSFKQIACHPYIGEVLNNYPYQKNPFGKRCFNFMLHHKLSILLAVMIKVNVFMRKGKE